MHESHEKPLPQPENPPSKPFSRRRFLQVSGISTLALGAAYRGGTLAQGGDGSGGGGGNGGGGHRGMAVAQSQPVSGTVYATNPETWSEPWVWRPAEWPGEPLHLYVVENNTPVGVTGPQVTQNGVLLFSYLGTTPGPTIRIRGNETIYMTLRNLLGTNQGTTPIGPSPDMNEVNGNVSADMAKIYQDYVQQNSIPAWSGEHVNGLHSAHTTNIHTHGLHVRPGLNSNGTQSDNVLLRLIPQGDFREREKPNSNAVLLYPDELAGEAHYEWRLGDIPGLANEVHMPGTFWYHPHAHGATQNQVASGMAGFFIVEGDVDDAINRVMLGDALADAQVTPSIPGLTAPQLDLAKPRGNYDYRERLILIARTGVPSSDPNATPHLRHEQGPNVTLINGSYFTESMWMNTGAVERWRILNASPDAKGFLRFTVLNGFAYVDTTAQALMLQQGTDAPITMTEANLDEYKLPLYLLSYDGVTLVEGNPTDGYHYTIERLADVNAGTQHPLAAENATIADCFADADSIDRAYNRPNEVPMSPANRADVFFQAPPLDPKFAQTDPTTCRCWQIVTVVARDSILHADDDEYRQERQGSGGAQPPAAICLNEPLAPVATEEPTAEPTASPTPQQSQGGQTGFSSLSETDIVAYIVVWGDCAAPPAELQTFENDLWAELIQNLPPVPRELIPPSDDDLKITQDEAAARNDVTAGEFRTRVVTYSGWGSADLPLVRYSDVTHPENVNPFYWIPLLTETGPIDGDSYYLLPPNIRTMAIDGYKFHTDDSAHGDHSQGYRYPRMWQNSSEEWVVYNASLALWGTPNANGQGYLANHTISYPITRAEAQAHNYILVTKAVDHPFHIHVNPFWLTRLDVPDANGNLVNVMRRPRWQDTTWLPRNMGRAVFRSRFDDYAGTFVNHCHILPHEDHGMMQAVEVTSEAAQTNYVARAQVTAPSMSPEEVTAIYPRMSLPEAYQRSMSMIDPAPNTGQVYPGVDVTVSVPVPPPM